jgi:hypothetical protein
MIYIVLNKPAIKLPINRQNHERLLAVCKRLAQDELIHQIYLHHNSMYITTVADLPEGLRWSQVYTTLGMLIGVSLRKHFACDLRWTVSEMGDLDDFTKAADIEKTNAEMLYEDYVEALTTDRTSDLFGTDAIVPFEKLPEFFRLGVILHGKNYRNKKRNTTKFEQVGPAMGAIADPLSEILKELNKSASQSLDLSPF